MTKVSELIGAELDKWVARAHGMQECTAPLGIPCWGYPSQINTDHIIPNVHVRVFKPSTEWQWGGPIIENKRIVLDPCESNDTWIGYIPLDDYDTLSRGPTPLVAAMRAFVASVYGDEVSE